MTSPTMSLLITLAVLTIACKTVVAVELKDIAEACSGNFITQDYKQKWDNSPQFKDYSFFVPLASKYHVYAMSQNLFRTADFKYISESQLRNSCLRQNKMDGWSGDLVNVTGYDTKSFHVRLAPTNVPKLFRFQLGGLGGYASIALTDNLSYNLFDYCFDNGLRSFAVVSSSRILDSTTSQIIKAHVKSLGFKESNFVDLNYVTCYDSDDNFVGNEDDLPRPGTNSIIGLPTIDFTAITGNSVYPSPFFFKKK